MSDSRLKVMFWALLFFCSFLLNGMAYAQEPLSLGLYPYLSATELIKRFSPLTNYLGRKIGRPVMIKLAKDYQEHINLAGKDKFDITFMGPVSYVQMVDRYGKKPVLARFEMSGKSTYQGIIIIAKESKLHTMADLNGKKFAFGSQDSTMGHHMPRFMLYKAGVTIDKLAGYKFFENQENVALGVLMGEYDAGAVREAIYNMYAKEGLKALAKTPPIPEHLFVASNRLPSKTVSALREAMYHLMDSEEGRTIMSLIHKEMTGLIPANDSDYNNLRAILRALEKADIKP